MTRPNIESSDTGGRTVTLSAEEWQDAVRLLQRLTGRGEPRPNERLIDRQTLEKRARQAFSDRRRRIAIFGIGMFGEPAWDMLLILYIQRHGQRQTVGGLAEASGVAKSTALRWLRALEARGHIMRSKHPTDSRTDFVQLTEKAELALDTYFSEALTRVR